MASGRLGSALAQESESQSDGLVCFELDDAKKLYRTVMDYSLLLKENEALKEEVANLKEQLKLKDSLLEISEERRQIQIERAEFYRSMAEAESKLSKRYEEMNERLQKQLERRSLWEKIGIGIAIIAGAAVGLAF